MYMIGNLFFLPLASFNTSHSDLARDVVNKANSTMAGKTPEDIGLTSLADSISADVKTITEILIAQKLPQPTLSASGPQQYPSGPKMAQLQEARMNLLTSAWALEQLAAGPEDYIYWQAYSV